MPSPFGYTGAILRIDLTTRTASIIETNRYTPQFVGGLGLAAAIAWDELGPGVGPFDPENLLMLMVGPLTGTLASGAGRVQVAGVAPQAYPPRFSRSNMGGHWGPELKYAGFDGIVIQGKADKPIYLWIHDGEVEFMDAGDLWGTTTYYTAQELRRRHDPRTRVIAIGVAGERQSRIACLQTETDNAAGQGGFGGVMGSKNLKAIAVRGPRGVRIARPAEFIREALGKSRESFGSAPEGSTARWPSRPIQSAPNMRTRKCGFCANVCTHPLFMNVPGVAFPGTFTTARQCYGYMMDNREATIAARAMTSQYGLNGWEITYGIIPWLQLCKQHGLIDAVDGIPISVPDKPIVYLRDVVNSSPELTARLIQIIAFQEGELGGALAQGACYAADVLFGGQGRALLDYIYPGRAGQTGHWTSHWGTGGRIYFPWHLPIVMQWCVDTRDPASDTSHAWTSHVQHWLPRSGPTQGPLPIEEVKAICAKVYGDGDVCDPAYSNERPELQAIPAIYHTDRGVTMDSLVLCEYDHGMVFNSLAEDHMADTGLMARLFSLATGYETSEAELQRSGERISQVLRAIDVRNYARDRHVDEMYLDTTFRFPGGDDGITIDRAGFMGIMDAYYDLRGWNRANGWPTRTRLEALGLPHVADGLEAVGRLG